MDPSTISEIEKELRYYQNQMDKIGGELINADSKITLLNRSLKQKKDGFGLLSELLKAIGTDTSEDKIFHTTLSYINQHLKIDCSIILEHGEKNHFCTKRILGGKKESQKTSLDFSNLIKRDDKYFLVRRGSQIKPLEEDIKEHFGIRFFIGVPIHINGALSHYLIAARQKEAQPFYPPFNQGDIETFKSIAGFLSSALTNHSLYNSLEKANETLEEYNESLEEKVRERTQTINQKNLKLEEAYSEITNSINYAKRIQSAILPNPAIINKLIPNSFVLYLPKDIVAGDFYWVEDAQDKILFSAADCTGHGVPGAMVSVVCHNAMNRAVREYGITDPGKILDISRDIIINTFQGTEEAVKDGMDTSLCSYNPTTRILEYSGANNSLYLIKKKNDKNIPKDDDISTDTHFLREFKGDRQPVGRFEFAQPFNTHKIKIEEEDLIIIYSDGYADQFGGEKGKKLKYKNFKNLILKHHFKGLDEIKIELYNFFETWRGDHEQIDDVIIMGVRF